MIGAGEERQLFGIGSRGNHARKFVGRRKLILVSAEKELGNGAVIEVVVLVAAGFGLVGGLNGKAERNERSGMDDTCARTAGFDGHGRTKAETDGHHGKSVLVFEPAESGFHVGGFRLAVVLALAAACPAKVEAKHRPSEPECGIVDGLHGVIHNLVMEGSPEERMRMADERRKTRVGSPFLQNGLKKTRGAGEVETAKRTSNGWLWNNRTLVRLVVFQGRRHTTPDSTRNGRAIAGRPAAQKFRDAVTFVWDYERRRHGELGWEAAVSGWLVRYSCSIMNKGSDLHAIDPVGLTRQLCEIESTTYNEGAVGDFLEQFLGAKGWAVEKTPVAQPLESATAAPRWNIYAGVAGQTPDLVLSTHMDTVPPYIPFSEDAEYMYGRGVSDAKGIIAAQVAAAQVLRADGLKVGLLFVSGEERDSAGAKAANEAPKGSKFLINGEPTDNRLALASKGALRAVFKASGKMCHSAYPELGDSAVHKLVEVLGKVLAIPLPSVEDVGPSTLNVGQIHGGHAPNVVADKAEAQVLVRLVGDSAPVRKALIDACGGLAEVDFTLEIPFVRLRAVEGLPTMIAKFTTDIPQLSNWGEPLLLGPGSIHVAHTPFEKLAKKELHEAVALYIKVARQLLA